MENKLTHSLNGIVFLLSTLIPFHSFSIPDSKIDIAIHVQESNSKTPVEFATVNLKDLKNKINSFVTDINGDIKTSIPSGRYSVTISSLGYKEKTLNTRFSLTNKTLLTQLEKGIELEQVEISEYKIPFIDVGNPAISKVVSMENLNTTPNNFAKTETDKSNASFHRYKNMNEADKSETDFSKKLTAGEINDFSKWKLWENESKELLKKTAEDFGIETGDRYCIQMMNVNGWPVIDASITLFNNSKVISTARTDNTGKAECWVKPASGESLENLTVNVSVNDGDFTFNNVKSFSEGINSFSIKEECNRPDNVDVAFIVDATGSMDDEINYLKSEMLELINSIKQNNADAYVRVASVFYRDIGERYTVKYYDFNSDVYKAAENIFYEGADSGGDTAEAMDSALVVATKALSWSTTARARIAFLIADAPPHSNKECKRMLGDAMTESLKKGIRFIPIACSNSNKSTEYLMRNIALLTNGTYLHLTDHSGVGYSHSKPTTDKMDHKKLNSILSKTAKRFIQSPECIVAEKEPVKQPVVMLNDEERLLMGESPGKDNNRRVIISPNPTSGSVEVTAKDKIVAIELYDINGKALKLISPESEKSFIDLTGFPVGQYLVRIVMEKSTELRKVVIAR